jgi:hypothetical protein
LGVAFVDDFNQPMLDEVQQDRPHLTFRDPPPKNEPPIGGPKRPPAKPIGVSIQIGDHPKAVGFGEESANEIRDP